MKNLIVVTSGAGFIGSSLIKSLLKKTNKKIISLDNYSSGNKKNQITDKRVKYLKAETVDISKNLINVKKDIHSIFHFGEFARIYQSFKKFDECFKSNSIGSNAVFKFCLDHDIKLIFSATLASLSNKGNDKTYLPMPYKI
jgi:UDP-glucose 4-epimerase